MRHVARTGHHQPGADRAHTDAYAAHASRTPRQDIRHALGQRFQVTTFYYLHLYISTKQTYLFIRSSEPKEYTFKAPNDYTISLSLITTRTLPLLLSKHLYKSVVSIYGVKSKILLLLTSQVLINGLKQGVIIN